MFRCSKFTREGFQNQHVFLLTSLIILIRNTLINPRTQLFQGETLNFYYPNFMNSKEKGDTYNSL